MPGLVPKLPWQRSIPGHPNPLHHPKLASDATCRMLSQICHEQMQRVEQLLNLSYRLPLSPSPDYLPGWLLQCANYLPLAILPWEHAARRYQEYGCLFPSPSWACGHQLEQYYCTHLVPGLSTLPFLFFTSLCLALATRSVGNGPPPDTYLCHSGFSSREISPEVTTQFYFPWFMSLAGILFFISCWSYFSVLEDSSFPVFYWIQYLIHNKPSVSNAKGVSGYSAGVIIALLICLVLNSVVINYVLDVFWRIN